MSGQPAVLSRLYLNPGEIVVAEGAAQVTTVLGSCVAVTLFCPKNRFGSICHGVLPHGRESEPGKYVDQAISYMLEFFRMREVALPDLVAKVFGGADMFSRPGTGRSFGTVGRQNIEAALAELARASIEPKVVEVGGNLGRKLVFYSHTGEVFVKKVRKEQLKAAAGLLAAKLD